MPAPDRTAGSAEPRMSATASRPPRSTPSPPRAVRRRLAMRTCWHVRASVTWLPCLTRVDRLTRALLYSPRVPARQSVASRPAPHQRPRRRRQPSRRQRRHAPRGGYMTTTRTPRAWPRLLFAFAALFTLATAAAQVELRMTWYDDGSEGQVLRDLLDRFEAENPDVRVVIDTVPYASGILQSLPLQLASGEGPDLARVTDLGGLSEYFLDLRPHLSDPDYWEENFGPFLNWMRPAGSDAIPGFMTQLTVTGPFVNRTLFDQAGVEVPAGDTTWEEWAEVTRQVAEATGTPYPTVMDRTGHRPRGPAASYGRGHPPGCRGHRHAVRDGDGPHRPPPRRPRDQLRRTRLRRERRRRHRRRGHAPDDAADGRLARRRHHEPRRLDRLAGHLRRRQRVLRERPGGALHVRQLAGRPVRPAHRRRLRLAGRAEPLWPRRVHRHAGRRGARRHRRHRAPRRGRARHGVPDLGGGAG